MTNIESPAQETVPNNERDSQATHVWLMRHGPTAWNLEKRIQGNVDTALAPEELSPYFDRVQVSSLPQVDRIIVSTFQRSIQTAEKLQEYLGWSPVPLVINPAFNERKWGIFEGKKHDEVQKLLAQNPDVLAKYPDLMSMQDLSSILDAPGFTVEGAESMDEVTARVTPALLSLRNAFAGEKLLIVAHAGVILSQGRDHRRITEMELRKTKEGISIQEL